MGLSFENILTFVSLSVLVLFAGITVIQSIFRISINEKIRNFGQLRTLGTTALQIKKMINYESRYLSWLGIPPGIVLGAIVGTVLGSNEFSSGFSPINIPWTTGILHRQSVSVPQGGVKRCMTPTTHIFFPAFWNAPAVDGICTEMSLRLTARITKLVTTTSARASRGRLDTNVLSGWTLNRTKSIRWSHPSYPLWFTTHAS